MPWGSTRKPVTDFGSRLFSVIPGFRNSDPGKREFASKSLCRKFREQELAPTSHSVGGWGIRLSILPSKLLRRTGAPSTSAGLPSSLRLRRTRWRDRQTPPLHFAIQRSYHPCSTSHFRPIFTVFHSSFPHFVFCSFRAFTIGALLPFFGLSPLSAVRPPALNGS